MLKLNAYQLKWIAVIGMLTNQMVIGLRELIPPILQMPLFALGGLTFPIMAFFVVEGYKYTSNLKNYLLRLMAFGLIAQLPYVLVFRVTAGFRGNIMFTIILGILLLLAYDKVKNRFLFALIFLGILLASLYFDWALAGVVVMFLYRVIPDEQLRRTLPPLFATAAFVGSPVFALGCLAATYLLYNYNGARGKQMKWLFYGFYPAHLAFIAALGMAFGLIGF